MIRIFIVHQTRLIANIIASVLSEEADIRVVGLADSTETAVAELSRLEADLVLVSARLPNQGALKLTAQITAQLPTVKVLVIGLPESESLILQYVMGGAAGYVLQDVPVERLLDNVRAAHDDRALVSPTIAAALMNHIAELAKISTQAELEPTLVDALTPREKEVLLLIGEDLTNAEIANRLFIEVGTVKNHVHNLLKKLDVSSREEAADFLPFIGGDALEE
jgi:DNA-binding NarL/FixJ family response regulator